MVKPEIHCWLELLQVQYLDIVIIGDPNKNVKEHTEIWNTTHQTSNLIWVETILNVSTMVVKQLHIFNQ